MRVLIYFNFLYAHMSIFHWEEGRLTVFGTIVSGKLSGAESFIFQFAIQKVKDRDI